MIQIPYKPFQEPEIIEIIIGDSLDVAEEVDYSFNNYVNHKHWQFANNTFTSTIYSDSLTALYVVSESTSAPE